MEAMDNRLLDANIGLQHEIDEDQALITRIYVEEEKLDLTFSDVLAFIFWFYNFHPILCSGIYLFYLISQFDIGLFDDFEDPDPPDPPMNFAGQLMIGVGENIGVEEYFIGQQEQIAAVEETNLPTHQIVTTDEPQNPPPITFRSQNAPIATVVHDNNSRTDNTDPVDDLTTGLAAMLPENVDQLRRLAYRRKSLDSGDEADNDNSGRSDDDREIVPTTHSLTTDEQMTQAADTRNNDIPSENMPPVSSLVRPRRKSRRQSSTIREPQSSSS